jgi:hypothetical protein
LIGRFPSADYGSEAELPAADLFAILIRADCMDMIVPGWMGAGLNLVNLNKRPCRLQRPVPLTC